VVVPGDEIGGWADSQLDTIQKAHHRPMHIHRLAEVFVDIVVPDDSVAVRV
jgi:hypothetical protein